MYLPHKESLYLIISNLLGSPQSSDFGELACEQPVFVVPTKVEHCVPLTFPL